MIPYVYLLGQSHSGSTVLAFLANAHPEVVSVGEVSRLGEILPDRWRQKNDSCSCGQPFYHCPFWNRALAGLAARGHGLTVTDPFGYPRGERKVAERRLLALVESMLEISGKRVFFDASKTLACAPVIAKNPHFRVSFLDLYRDGRGIVISWLRRVVEKQPERVVRAWVEREKLRRKALAALGPAPVLRLKYEDFARSPREELRRLFAFLGVETEADVTAGFKSRVEHHIVGNQMRLNDQETITLDEKWRAAWTPEMERVFTAFGADEINRRNGYAD